MWPWPVCGVKSTRIFQVASAANQIWSLGRRNLALEVDATDPADVEASIQQVHAEWGRLDILVNAHDQMLVVPFDETGRDEWDAALATNLTAVALACQAAGHVMMLQGQRPDDQHCFGALARTGCRGWRPTPPPAGAWRG